jgi:hypothetical protein
MSRSEYGYNNYADDTESVVSTATAQTTVFSGGYSQKNKSSMSEIAEERKEDVLSKMHRENLRLKRLHAQNRNRVR